MGTGMGSVLGTDMGKGTGMGMGKGTDRRSTQLLRVRKFQHCS